MLVSQLVTFQPTNSTPTCAQSIFLPPGGARVLVTPCTRSETSPSRRRAYNLSLFLYFCPPFCTFVGCGAAWAQWPYPNTCSYTSSTPNTQLVLAITYTGSYTHTSTSTHMQHTHTMRIFTLPMSSLSLSFTRLTFSLVFLSPFLLRFRLTRCI